MSILQLLKWLFSTHAFASFFWKNIEQNGIFYIDLHIQIGIISGVGLKCMPMRKISYRLGFKKGKYVEVCLCSLICTYADFSFCTITKFNVNSMQGIIHEAHGGEHSHRCWWLINHNYYKNRLQCGEATKIQGPCEFIMLIWDTKRF